MLIRRLVLENYGLFGGRNEFDLLPRIKYGAQRPIILFGGQNGAGKTTLLEAIRLVLYGRLSLGSRVRSVDYDAFLHGRVHRDKTSLLKPKGALIAIEFEHVHRGTRDKYFVERSWQASGSTASEKLSVLRNDRPLEEVDADFWQGFVRDIIPEGLSQLFFFDAEKIRELAEDTTGSGVLADSIKSLLGLDLVERLDADLSVYTTREVAKLGTEEDRNRVVTLDNEIKNVQVKLANSVEELAANRTHQDGVLAEIRRAEELLRQSGENLADKRLRLQSDKVTVCARVEQVEKALRDECESVFPFTLCPRMIGSLRKHLSSEYKHVHDPQVRAALDRTRLELLKTARIGSSRLTGTSAKTFRSIVETVFARQAPKAPPTRGQRHRLSDSDQRKINVWLDQANRSRSNVAALCSELASGRHRLETIERKLAQIPSDGAVRPHIEALTELSRRLGNLEQARTEAEERQKSFRFQLEGKERERRNIVERYRDGVSTGQRIELARSVQTALGDYLQRLTQLKVQQLRETVARCFNRLCRKGDIVDRIEIDPNTFGITLFGRDDHAIPKEELSSGEKQIFSIAMLWGLAQTSGRPLPVIIDTPLGRLDSEHRRKLVEEYFPHASHQVVLLSTDTEVDQELFEQLSPSVSHSYQLRYHEKDARTEIEEGYFWRKLSHA